MVLAESSQPYTSRRTDFLLTHSRWVVVTFPLRSRSFPAGESNMESYKYIERCRSSQKYIKEIRDLGTTTIKYTQGVKRAFSE